MSNIAKPNFYSSDKYIDINPTLHEEDSDWKIGLIIPMIDIAMKEIRKEEINLLDVGGGKGLILKSITDYIEKKYSVKVNKYILDLSPGMLEIQNENNKDIKIALEESISKTSLKDKEIDITLLIDVLEHVPNYLDALKELKRISSYTILKVPLEDCLYVNLPNALLRGQVRKRIIKKLGHVNVYNNKSLEQLIRAELGDILQNNFSNVFRYYLDSNHYKSKMSIYNRLINYSGNILFNISPSLASKVFIDFSVMLVRNF